jgi:hypothetical protein
MSLAPARRPDLLAILMKKPLPVADCSARVCGIKDRYREVPMVLRKLHSTFCRWQVDG